MEKLCPVLLVQSLQSPEPKNDSSLNSDSSNTIPDLSGPVFTRGQHQPLTNSEKLYDLIMGENEKNQVDSRHMDNQTIPALLEQYVPLFKVWCVNYYFHTYFYVDFHKVVCSTSLCLW